MRRTDTLDLVPLSRSAAPLQPRPTPALTRAVVAGCSVALLAMLAGRPTLLLLAVPLLAWAAIARARHTATHQDHGVPGPQVRTSARSLTEGSGAAIEVTTAPGLLTTVTLPLSPAADLNPPRGSLCADGQTRFSLLAHRWGRLEVGPMHVMVLDPLAAHRAQAELAAAALQVIPAASVLEATTAVPTPIGISGVHLSSRRGDGTALADVREFRPGDRLARINWRVTNRTGRMHTNATYTEQDTDVLVVTDTLADIPPAPGVGTHPPSSLDLTIRATTAVARHYLSIGDRVALHDLGYLIGPVRPGTGPRQLRVLVDVLSRAKRGSTGRTTTARRLRSVRTGTLVVVCSPLLAPAAIDQVSTLLALGGDVVVIDTLPPSLGSPEHCARSARSHEPPRARRFWAEAWALRRLQRERVLRELREAGVPVTRWDGPGSLAPVLLSLAQLRSAPRMRRS